MIGSSALTTYAGQSITMLGIGALAVSNVAGILSGGSTLTAKSAVVASASMSGSGTMIITSTAASVGSSTFPAMRSIGADKVYCVGGADLPVLTSSGAGGFYIPPEPTIGFAWLSALSSVGASTTTSVASGGAYLQAIQSQGGVEGYGKAGAYIPALVSWGVYEIEDQALLVSGVEGASVSEMVSDMVIILTSEGTLAASFTADRVAVTQFLSDITGESSFASTAELLTSLLSSGGFTDSISAAVGDRAAIDGQVWVVNLATEASSQYDDFGFNSFFTHEGRHYGVASDGIYLLEGATDNGEVIESMVDFGINDCGLPHRKKITNVRIGTTDGADTVLEVTTDTGTREYKLERSKEGDFFWRARMPHVQQGVYWRFVLKSSTQFELNSIDFAPANLTRRF